MILIPKEDRINRLLENGIPKGFLEKIGEIKELEFSVEKPEGAYYYIPTIANYEIIKGCEITPIYDCGESFYVLAQSKKTIELSNSS